MQKSCLPMLLIAIVLFTVLPRPGSAQSGEDPTEFEACYVPDVGALYLINLPGLPTECLDPAHEPIGWTEGGGVTDHGALSGLTDDDHPQYLLADGVSETTDGFAVSFSGITGSIPVEGLGTRMMWYPEASAFRVGRVTGTQWDDVNIGTYSVAMGYNTTASAARATAMGSETTASGLYATAMGINSTASGNTATSMGFGTTASGNQATAMGISTTAPWRTSLVIGSYNDVEGDWFTSEPLFMAGNGDSSAPSNALVLQRNGNLTIAGTLYETSDARLKTGIEPLESALDGLRAIEPVRFRFREGTGHPTSAQIGLLAQEVGEVFPELVSRDGEGHLGLDYPKLTAVLLKGLQEQQATIEQQRAALREQQEAQGRMQERIARLEAIVGESRSITR